MHYLDHLLECPIGPSLKVLQLRRLFDWTNMAAALPQFFGAACHPCFEVSDRVALSVGHRLIKTQIGHARDFTWYRDQRPSPARVILSHEREHIHARENLCNYATNPPHFRVRELLLCDILITRAGDGRWPRYQAKSLACPGCGVGTVTGVELDVAHVFLTGDVGLMRGGTASVRQRYLDVPPWVIWPCLVAPVTCMGLWISFYYPVLYM